MVYMPAGPDPTTAKCRTMPHETRDRHGTSDDDDVTNRLEALFFHSSDLSCIVRDGVLVKQSRLPAAHRAHHQEVRQRVRPFTPRTLSRSLGLPACIFGAHFTLMSTHSLIDPSPCVTLSITWTVYDVRWIPDTPRFVALGAYARQTGFSHASLSHSPTLFSLSHCPLCHTGCLIVYELNHGELKVVAEV